MGALINTSVYLGVDTIMLYNKTLNQDGTMNQVKATLAKESSGASELVDLYILNQNINLFLSGNTIWNELI